MFEITFLELCIFTTIIWILSRALVALKTKTFAPRRELQLILVYVCIIVISRIVYFPWHHINGHIDTLKFDAAKILPLKKNLIPCVHLSDIYDGWQMNIIGNITMFIPVGIIWPACFKQLNSIWKTILAGAGFSLLIEITQLPFYDRCSDIDDLLLNTTGVAIGALIYFGIYNLILRAQKTTSTEIA